MKNESKYVQFPLFMLRDLWTKKEETINDIIEFGIYNYSKKITLNVSEVARQLMYDYYRKQDKLTSYLRETIRDFVDHGKIEIDEDFQGFHGSEFNPEMEVDSILELFETDSDFKNNAVEYWRVRTACESLEITGNYAYSIQIGKNIEKTIPRKEPMPMVKESLLFEFRDNEKSEFELAQLIGNIAIRSIMGEKKYCKTNKEMIVCRMFGYSSKKHLPEKIPLEINELYKKKNTLADII